MKKIVKQAERNLLIILLFIPITGNLLLNVVSDFSIVDDLSFETVGHDRPARCRNSSYFRDYD